MKRDIQSTLLPHKYRTYTKKEERMMFEEEDMHEKGVETDRSR